MPRKNPHAVPTGFGARLVALRKARGWSQAQLATALGVKQPTVSYYEKQAGHPQADVLAKLAHALGVSADELLGTRAPRRPLPTDDPEARRLWKKFQHLLDLPEKDRRAVIHMLNGLREARGKSKTA